MSEEKERRGEESVGRRRVSGGKGRRRREEVGVERNVGVSSRECEGGLDIMLGGKRRKMGAGRKTNWVYCGVSRITLSPLGRPMAFPHAGPL